MKKFLFILLFLSLLTNISFGLIKYIKPSSSGIGDGSSWANASSDLQLMINSSNAGDTIWVATGTYVPIRPSNQTNIIDLKNRNNAFVLKPNINIFGGFLGNELTNFSLSNRDFTNNQSILSGDFNLDDVYDSSTDTIITGNSENAYSVLISTGNIGSVKIDGLTFKGGNGHNGGGLNINTSSPSFFNCKFLSNQASTLGGGGIYLMDSNSTFTKCLIKGNEGLFGAGIYTIRSTLGFTECIFKNNVALKFDPNDGQGEAFGAGIITFNSNISIIDCDFSDNYANYGAAMVHFESTVVTKRTRFSNNKATSNGGAILSKKGTEQFINCQFISNSAKNGGALFTTNPNQNFINTTFLRNTATNNGGVVYNGFENEFFPVTMNQIFTNCTFDSNNASSSGKLIFGFGFGYSFDNTVKFNNSIVWLNKNFSYSGNDLLSGSSINGFNAKYLLNNSVLQGSITSNITLNSSSLGLLNVNPSLDFSFYIPKDNSVARNAGDNSLYTSAGGNLLTDLDLRSEQRLINSNIDIGAFENQTSTLPITLISFKGKQAQNSITLNWETSSETNNDRFIVSSSQDGKVFKAISEIRSFGDSNEIQKYRTVDYNPFYGINYYQLIQVDKNGDRKEVAIIAIDFKHIGLTAFEVYPNPITYGIINISGTGLEDLQNLKIYNLSGIELINEKINFSNGLSSYKINKPFEKGIYVLKIGDSYTMKVIME